MASYPSRRSRAVVASLFAALAVTILVNCRPDVPREGWNESWGPLVPHHTFPGDCAICHLPDRWDVLRDDFSFDHEKETGYPLEGAHAEAACLRCHNDRGPVTAYVARGCGGCHPDPHASSLGLDCERCHDQRAWEPTGLIGEHARTRFPLYGTHAVTPCESCHPAAQAGQFRGAPIECELCHQTDLAQATSPDHLTNGWVMDCQRCHTTTVWASATVPHDAFPLVGGHGGLECTQCHTSGTFEAIPSDCYLCHQTDYEGAPDHVAQSFSQDCEQCHSIAAWTPATFSHTIFQLTGAHADLTCVQCHTSGAFEAIPYDCYSCHATDYTGAPDHVAQNFSQDCEECHSVVAWTPATFSHTFFPLTGGHADLDCLQCHTSGTVGTIPSACYSCHSDDYSGAADHASLGFPQDCEECHTTSAWTPATFDHEFPLTGAHDLSCTDCHTTGSTSAFSCIDCHEHRQDVVDDEHDDVGSYTYSSQACYNCHPNGRE